MSQILEFYGTFEVEKMIIIPDTTSESRCLWRDSILVQIVADFAPAFVLVFMMIADWFLFGGSFQRECDVKRIKLNNLSDCINAKKKTCDI